MFAEQGLQAASTDEIARRAGISQPYVFRLFGTKKELFSAVVARCFRQTLGIFQQAAEGKRGEEALHAIGAAYDELLRDDRVYLRSQMQAYAACDDPEIRRVVQHGFGDLVTYVEHVSGADGLTVQRVLREGDADERARLDAAARPDRAVGQAPARRRRRTETGVFFDWG